MPTRGDVLDSERLLPYPKLALSSWLRDRSFLSVTIELQHDGEREIAFEVESARRYGFVALSPFSPNNYQLFT